MFVLAVWFVVLALLNAPSAEAVRIGSGAPGHVGVVNQAHFDIKVSGHTVHPAHTIFNVDSDTITVRAGHRWHIKGLGNGINWGACQPANKTRTIGVTANNTGPAHQFVVAAC